MIKPRNKEPDQSQKAIPAPWLRFATRMSILVAQKLNTDPTSSRPTKDSQGVKPSLPNES